MVLHAHMLSSDSLVNMMLWMSSCPVALLFLQAKQNFTSRSEKGTFNTFGSSDAIFESIRAPRRSTGVSLPEKSFENRSKKRFDLS